MALELDNELQTDSEAPVAGGEVAAEPKIAETELALVRSIQKRIKVDKDHHGPAFTQMRADMYMARNGCAKDYPSEHYRANLAGRHVKQKTSALYAKNPKATARRRETLDFAVWDENPQTLQTSMQALMQGQQLLGSLPVHPDTGQPVVDESNPEIQQALQAFEQAQAVVEDFKQGMERRTFIQKIGKTLEILYSQALREQSPLDFKTAMKQLVRRACTTGVGYIEIGFQREYGPRPGVTEHMADFQARLAHLKALTERVTDEDEPIDPDDPEIAELEKALAALQAEEEIITREGLSLDYPQSTHVIPDKLCQSLVGFIGSRHLTVEYMYTRDQVEEVFGVDLGDNFTGYGRDGKNPVDVDTSTAAFTDDARELSDMATFSPKKDGDLVCVWKHYDKVSGLVYYAADGYSKFLREPAGPDVFVETFWPVYALTFNEVEDEATLFPPSDVYLMKDQQHNYNLSRQGMKEHRKAARPRWTFANGAMEQPDADRLAGAAPFTATGINLPPGTKLGDVLDVIPVPGVDPNLYETGQLFTDIQMVVGSSEAQFGGTAQATATESAIAANSSAASDGSSVDDLDSFLTVVARASGQVLLREMSEEKVKEIVGVGAVWPHQTLSQIADELFLEVEAGSTGKPNQAIEINNWNKMLPFLLQMPNIDPSWLARESLRRLGDRMDLTEALTAGMPSILAQNGLAQASTGDPASDPNAQGAAGEQNAPTESGEQQGSTAAFGSNQV
ncbi:hypothetical protein OEG84_11485 [Hoeflea sp. G2-23]|uniref:Portal protein n=1 Tax=Hoeflea algicola TaxID=2983763 RepID=A0ABT3Z974_9HYPH|nr:hypothetical protein [Hoeflea algicola]MCY0148315.1 hypothetical protein [Hoeflea algicola]